jgi:hypothetical protein
VVVDCEVILAKYTAEKLTQLLRSWEYKSVSGESTFGFEIIGVPNNSEESGADGVQEELKLDSHQQGIRDVNSDNLT